MRNFWKIQIAKTIGITTLTVIFMAGFTSCSKDHCAAYGKVSSKNFKTKSEAKMGKRLALAKR